MHNVLLPSPSSERYLGLCAHQFSGKLYSKSPTVDSQYQVILERTF